MGCSGVVAVGKRGDGPSHEALRVVHQIFIGRRDGVETVLSHQLHVALGANARGLDLRLHVADHKLRGANVVHQDLPDLIDTSPGVIDFDRLELQAFRIGVDGIDDAAGSRSERPDVEVMGGRHGEADQGVIEKDRHAERHVGPMARPAIGIIVHDHVAWTDRGSAALHRCDDVLHIARDGA